MKEFLNTWRTAHQIMISFVCEGIHWNKELIYAWKHSFGNEGSLLFMKASIQWWRNAFKNEFRNEWTPLAIKGSLHDLGISRICEGFLSNLKEFLYLYYDCCIDEGGSFMKQSFKEQAVLHLWTRSCIHLRCFLFVKESFRKPIKTLIYKRPSKMKDSFRNEGVISNMKGFQ